MRAPSAITALSQADLLWPGRNRASDGICGDSAHQQRNSAHNPGRAGYCHAVDVTNDPANGCDGKQVYEALRAASRDGIESRATVLIHARRYASRRTLWTSVPYLGRHPHHSHVHVSIEDTDRACQDESPWPLGGVMPDRDLLLPVVSQGTEARRRLEAYCAASFIEWVPNGDLSTCRVRESKLPALEAFVASDDGLASNSPGLYDPSIGHTSVNDWQGPWPQTSGDTEEKDKALRECEKLADQITVIAGEALE